MAPRASDIKAVEALLHEPAEDAAALALRVIETLDELRASRDGFAVGVTTPYGVSWLYGPYTTAHQAQTAISKGVGAPIDGMTCVGVLQLFSARPGVGAEPAPVCPTCQHPRQAHNWPRSKVRGCVVGLPPSDPNKRPLPGTPARCDCEGDGR